MEEKEESQELKRNQENIANLKQLSKPPNNKCNCGKVIEPILKTVPEYWFRGYYVDWEWQKAWIKCDECIEKEREEETKRYEKRQAEIREEEKERHFNYIGFSKINKSMIFNTFIVNESNKNAFEYALKYSDVPESNVFITGKCGSGKTHLASAIAMKMHENGKGVRFVTVPELLLRVRDTFNRKSNISELDLIEEYRDIRYLFLDDFGAEKVSEWTLEFIFLLIDMRIRDVRPFIITSNLTIEEISKIFNDRIASRIAGNCKIIELKDYDHRVKK